MVTQTTHKNTKEIAKEYLDSVYDTVCSRNPDETEFHQVVKEIFDSLVTVIAQNPEYMEHGILDRIVEPERLITFRVPWVDDEGQVHVNRGYRVQFNSAIGPYKGGLRFHPSVNPSVVKFLGFEQIFKNSLTGQPIGGGKGGADFDPKGKSDAEIMRFSQSFMHELGQYIGPNVDIPAGDIGVGAREIGYMFGQYKKMHGRFEAGTITGKGLNYGGSLVRKEATGFGIIYFVEEMLKQQGLKFQDQTIAVSGSGNVSIYAMEKAQELGAKVVTCSDSDGYIYDEKGIDVETVKRLKEVERTRIEDYTAEHPHAKYFDSPTDVWSVPCTVALPCATQQEIDEETANLLVENGVIAVGEGANMPTTLEAINLFKKNNVHFAPAKAANAGGVAVSSLEMAQNNMGFSWSFEEVDGRLREIMKDIYDNSSEAAETYGYAGNLVIGANIAGFLKVADAMMAQGVV
ncbi:NADP-specific glutamate dehydrogenase [Salicibibacter kimchii]|uniref:Glutamate dehydrogenase n=1 Tax=Salicibibacter kimchii TaxID=2099786 RepID=A0A345BXY7_9BACI|nr:NADP-specific glutamate dehydrogenase [Salicibibacter kimchii]AXF55818.1 NADP-specific glutamate dehydrogenase [Salicibibacter kimchii]